VLDLRQGDRDRAGRRLRLVVAGTKEGEALWCKAMYQRAAVELADVPAHGPGRPQAARIAYRTARHVLLSVLRQIDDGTSPELDELRRLEGPLIVATASIVMLANASPGQPSFDRSRITFDWRFSLIARLDAAKVPSAEPDALSAAEIIARVDAGDVVVGERTHYNLACFSSREAALHTVPERAGALAESLRQLKLALGSGDPGLTTWAAEDAGLAEVRGALPRAFAVATGVAAPRELAGIRAIGSDLAAELEVEGILTASELAETMNTRRRQLAAQLGVSIELVNRWAGLARLRRLPLMTDDYVNQLDEANVRSRSRLATLEPEHLRARLLNANGDVPPRALLDVWRGEAAQAPGN
jgi:Domain of unknown function (DUF4332)